MAELIVEVKNVSKSFGDFVVLDDVSLEVERGENLVIFGKSGTGKSVLLKCMVGLLKPEKGTIFITGKDVANLNQKDLNEMRKKISFLFQSGALYDSMTVRENLEFPLIRNYNFTRGEINQKVEKALSSVKLLNAIDKMPSELSGGMRKRIGLARAIITEPELILYDEPTTGLDPITTKGISKLIRDLQKELKMSAISITHDLICAEIIADRAIIIKDGKIRHQGLLGDLIKSDDPFLQNFFTNEIIDEQ
jgi:phospholipid/cholesterol/gamma-HCH transport system ATP-binding protein